MMLWYTFCTWMSSAWVQLQGVGSAGASTGGGTPCAGYIATRMYVCTWVPVIRKVGGLVRRRCGVGTAPHKAMGGGDWLELGCTCGVAGVME